MSNTYTFAYLFRSDGEVDVYKKACHFSWYSSIGLQSIPRQRPTCSSLPISCFRPALLLSYSLSNKMMFFKSLAIAAGIAFAAISSVCATPAEAADVSQGYTYVQEKSLVYILEKTKYEVTPVVQKFRMFYSWNVIPLRFANLPI